jgi:Ca2+-binding EF-hand superfamily protein
MKVRNGTSLMVPIALSAALAMPMALAQETTDQETQDWQSETQTQHGDPSWNALDTDGDGYIGREEAAAHPELSNAFDDADADGDGQISQEEHHNFMDMDTGSHMEHEEPVQEEEPVQ